MRVDPLCDALPGLPEGRDPGRAAFSSAQHAPCDPLQSWAEPCGAPGAQTALPTPKPPRAPSSTPTLGLASPGPKTRLPFWKAPLTLCIRAVFWGCSALMRLGVGAASWLGTWAHHLHALAGFVWPAATDAATAQPAALFTPPAGAPTEQASTPPPAAAPALHGAHAAQTASPRVDALHAKLAAVDKRLGLRTLQALRGTHSADTAALPHAARIDVLRAYYPVAQLTYALRGDADVSMACAQGALYVPVPDDLRSLRDSAMGLTHAAPHARASSSAKALSEVRAAAQWVAASPAWRHAQHAARRLLQHFVPNTPFDPANAAETRGQALLAWDRASRAPALHGLALCGAAAAMPDGCALLVFDLLAPVDQVGCVQALCRHAPLPLSALLTHLVAPEAWPQVDIAWAAQGASPNARQHAWAHALRFAALPPLAKNFMLDQALSDGGLRLTTHWALRLSFAEQLAKPTGTQAWTAIVQHGCTKGHAPDVVGIAAEVLAWCVAHHMLTPDAAQASLAQSAAAAGLDKSVVRQAACAAGLGTSGRAHALLQQVCDTEAADASVMAQFARALIFEADAPAQVQAAITAVGTALQHRLWPLDALAKGNSDARAEVARLDVADVHRVGQGPASTCGVVIAGIRIDLWPPATSTPTPTPTTLLQPHVILPQEAVFAASWRQGRAMLLEGPAGSGKTQLVSATAQRLGLALHRMTLGPQTDEQDLIGRFVVGAARKPVFVDGLVVHAMRLGEVVLLDEANLAPQGLLERLNSVFDSRNLFIETTGEHLVAHPNFRLVLAANPGRYQGRRALGEALRSRLRQLACPPLPAAILHAMVRAQGEAPLPHALCDAIVAAHVAIGCALGSHAHAQAFEQLTPRALVRVVRRVRRHLSDAAGRPVPMADGALRALAAREMQDVYQGFVPATLGRGENVVTPHIRQALGPVMPTDVSCGLVDAGAELRLGDLTWPKPKAWPLTTQLVLTPRVAQILYRLLKAMLAGEPVGLIGRRAGGKTALCAYAAALLGQPFVQQVLSMGADAATLVGAFGPQGWQDGALLALGRPDAEPGVLLLDECNLAAPAVLERLNAVLDDARTLTLTECDGAEVVLHQDFRLVCAMNPPGAHNPGRHRLSQAFVSRLTWIDVPDASCAEQDSIAQAVACSLGVGAGEAVRLTSCLRHFVDHGLPSGDSAQPSLRELLAATRTWVDLAAQMPESAAFGMALEAEYGAFWPDAAPEQWRARAQAAWHVHAEPEAHERRDAWV